MTGKTERVEQTIRCPRGDGRAVARVVVRDGARHLDIMGGRTGHLAEVTEFIGAQTGQPAREVVPAHYEIDMNLRPSSTALDDGARQSFDELGPLEFRAVCPKCNTVYTLVAAFALDSWSVVLGS